MMCKVNSTNPLNGALDTRIRNGLTALPPRPHWLLALKACAMFRRRSDGMICRKRRNYPAV